MLFIREIDVLHIRRPLRTPWKTAYGIETDVEGILVRSVSDDGQVAWIESCPLTSPLYLPETADTTFQIVTRHIAPAVLGRPFELPEDAFDYVKAFKGNSFAKAAIDLSFWAQLCYQKGIPLHKALRGADEPVPVGRGFGLHASVDALIESIAAARLQGCQRAKLKVNPGTTLVELMTVRKAFPHLALQVDCNGSFGLEDVSFFLELDVLGFELIEQPFDYRDLPAHADLQKKMVTPICLDESVCDVIDAKVAIRLGACQAMSLKPGRVGGITPFLRILDLCKDNGIGCYVGGMLESGLGTAMTIELSTLDGITYCPDVPLSGQYFSGEIITPDITLCHGRVPVSTQPWLGRDVLSDRLDDVIVRRSCLKA